MEKKICLTAAVLTLALFAGCGNTNERQTQQPENGNSQDLNSQDEKPQSDHSQAETPQQAENNEAAFSFEKVADRVFYFSSGAGAWHTELFINGDGTFRGHYQDSDMGDAGETYPDGTLYYCSFTGSFCDLTKVDEFTYKMKLSSIAFEQEQGKEEIIDGVRYIYSSAYGLDDGGDFYLYLPGANLNDLPKEYLSWVASNYGLDDGTETTLPFYGLYNINTGDGFSSNAYEEQSLDERIAMEISFAEEMAAELEDKLQNDTTQSDMNETSKELFQTWDDTLNIVWKLLASELDDTAMEALRTEERSWITMKEAEAKAAGQEYEGGSMQTMAELTKAAELTKERVYELAEYAK